MSSTATLLSSGNVQVNNATLTGVGSAGNVFVNGGGTLAVGDGTNTMSVAALTPSATSFLNIYTNAAGYNPLAVSGAVALPSSGVTLNLTNGSNASGTYHLMSYGSLSGLSSSTFTITGSPLAGDKFTIMADSGSTNYLDFVISTDGTWIQSGSGTWSSSGNWANNNVPGGTALDSAVFGPALTSGTATVILDSSRSLSSLGFSTTGGASYLISPSGTSTLTLSNTGSAAAAISGSGGNHTVGAAITLGSNLSVSVTGGSVLTIAGGIGESGGNRSLSLSGGGELMLGGTDTYTGGTTISNGTLGMTTASALPSSGLVTIGSGGRLVLGGGSGIGALLGASSDATFSLTRRRRKQRSASAMRAAGRNRFQARQAARQCPRPTRAGAAAPTPFPNQGHWCCWLRRL